MFFHLLAAIGINCFRAMGYAYRSKGRSLPRSMVLILSELLSLPSALLCDVWAALYLRLSLSYIFVSMRGLPSPHCPPLYTGLLRQQDFYRVYRHSMAYVNHCRLLRGPERFLSIAKETRKQILAIQQEQVSLEVHFAMTLHLLESIGMTALCFIQRASKSNRGPVFFGFLIRLQIHVLWLSMYFDRWVNPLHQKGLGIVIHDVPTIPFLKKMRMYTAKQ